ncbi:MAG: hypothetical protein WAW85_16410 [Gordonia sp. (in: high G+C Gram-positive bacteria)]|uniref:hypothetical protein n=1 Tax=Gordonia sp. (in: high G+C Gram-positive bacteria) TaxID=84139 RepID=UPI003BB4CAE2
MKIVASVAAALAVALLTASCSLAGTPRTLDYASRLLPADAFPTGPATLIPAAQLPGIVADLTLRPLSGEVNPARCTPPAVQTDTAVAAAGPGPSPGATLTQLVVSAEDSLESFAAATAQCPSFRAGATGNQVVTTMITEEPVATGLNNALTRMRLVRTLGAGNTQTVMEQWLAQQGEVRLMVVVRQLGSVSDADRQIAQAFFDRAVAHVYGGEY